MEDGHSGNWGDRIEIGLLFAALFSSAFVFPAALFGVDAWPELWLAGAPSLGLATLGVATFGARRRLSATLLLVAAPLAVALGLQFVEAPPGADGVGYELALAVTALAYFLGTARALGGPSGRLPSGSAQVAILPASALLLAVGLAGASLEGMDHYAEHFGDGALEARFLGSSIALVLASVTMLSVGPALARAPRLKARAPQQLVGRLVLYFSLALVGLLLLARIT